MKSPEPEGKPLKDATHLYTVAHRAYHAQRSDFRITEIGLNSDQCIPWHKHSRVSDTFYVLSGSIDIYLLEPKELIHVEPHDTYKVVGGRPHLVVNAGETLANFLVLQGGGAYDNTQMPEIEFGSERIKNRV